MGERLLLCYNTLLYVILKYFRLCHCSFVSGGGIGIGISIFINNRSDFWQWQTKMTEHTQQKRTEQQSMAIFWVCFWYCWRLSPAASSVCGGRLLSYMCFIHTNDYAICDSNTTILAKSMKHGPRCTVYILYGVCEWRRRWDNHHTSRCSQSHMQRIPMYGFDSKCLAWNMSSSSIRVCQPYTQFNENHFCHAWQTGSRKRVIMAIGVTSGYISARLISDDSRAWRTAENGAKYRSIISI